MPLHLNIEDLLSAQTVESDRIEFKEGWNPDAVYRSICGFANDFDNIGGELDDLKIVRQCGFFYTNQYLYLQVTATSKTKMLYSIRYFASKTAFNHLKIKNL